MKIIKNRVSTLISGLAYHCDTLNIIYNIIIVIIVIFNIYSVISGNVIYCDNGNISELSFNSDNNLSDAGQPNELRRESIHSCPAEFSTIPHISLRERMRRKISWYLFSKDLIRYEDFKENWYPSRSVWKQLKIEFRDFLDNPREYSTNTREWLMINNCKYYKDNPDGTFFVQGMGYLEAKYVHYLTAKYGYVVHNNRFVKVDVENIGKIVRKVYFDR
uniref:Uncharacterized protein n=1 Tax=Fusarium ananatum TaxID=545334 RepID=A0A6M4B020_9HYPO|nr:hypothetical protein [Fusarium ananatum]